MRTRLGLGAWMGVLGTCVLAAALGACASPARAKSEIEPLSVAVIKSTTGLCARGALCHRAKAGSWTPETDVAILAASIPEQVDVDLYVDIEISTGEEMYLTAGHIFRVKYAGPGLLSYGASSGSTYLGSNVTTTNITFPSGYGIRVPRGTPIYVHLDVRNESLIDVKVDQDAYLYYVPLR